MMGLLHIGGYVLFILGLLYVLDVVRELRYRVLSTRNGCKTPKYVSNFPLGLRGLWNMLCCHRDNEFYENTVRMLDNVGKKTYRAQAVGGVIMTTVEPENIKALLATQFTEFDLGTRHSEFQPLLGDGIFTLSGDGWYHSRALLRPQFTKEQVSQLKNLELHTNTLLQIFKEQSSFGSPVDIQQYFFKLTLDTATEFLFGESTGTLSRSRKPDSGLTESEEFAEAFNTGQTWLVYRSLSQTAHPLVTGKEFRRCTKVCHRFVDNYVQRALERAKNRNEEKLDDVYDDRYIFLDQLTKETTDPVLMRDQALNILLAGRDTTAGLLSFTISLLLRHKPVWYKLRDVVRSDFGDTTSNISFRTLKRCVYLKHVINETLRLYPIVPINFRRATRNTTLPRGGGADEQSPVYVEKGTTVLYYTYALQRRKEYWGEDADEFRPGRWMEGEKVLPWTYIPFNGGPRICLGQQFALTEVSYVLVRILQTFSDVHSTPDVEDSSIKQYATLTSSVAGGVPVLFKE
jgi:cytochrome P450